MTDIEKALEKYISSKIPEPFFAPLCIEEAQSFTADLNTYGFERAITNIFDAVYCFARPSWLYVSIGDAFVIPNWTEERRLSFALEFTPKEWRALHYCIVMYCRLYNCFPEYNELIRIIEDRFEKYTLSGECWFSEHDGSQWIKEIDEDHSERIPIPY